MRLATCFAVAFSLLNSSWSLHLEYDKVAPFPEVNDTTRETVIALKFKPRLHINSGCHPYPAIDALGNTNAGLRVTEMFKPCNGSPLGSQVYGRAMEHNGFIGIMYAWYLPKSITISPVWIDPNWMHAIVWLSNLDDDANLQSVSVMKFFGYSSTSPSPEQMDGNHVKLMHKEQLQTSHYLTLTDKAGEFLQLIMWNNMTDAAREKLEEARFNGFTAPISTAKFKRYIKQAYPF